MENNLDLISENFVGQRVRVTLRNCFSAVGVITMNPHTSPLHTSHPYYLTLDNRLFSGYPHFNEGSYTSSGMFDVDGLTPNPYDIRLIERLVEPEKVASVGVTAQTPLSVAEEQLLACLPDIVSRLASNEAFKNELLSIIEGALESLLGDAFNGEVLKEVVSELKSGIILFPSKNLEDGGSVNRTQ